MADGNITGATALTHIINSEIIDNLIALPLRENSTIMPLVAYRKLSEGQGAVHTFTGWPTDTAADITETTDIDATVVGTLTNVQVTAGVVGIMREVSDYAAFANLLGPDGIVRALVADGSEACRVMAEDDLANLLDAATGATLGTTTVDFSVADLVQGIAGMRTLNVPGPYVAVFDDQAAYDLMLSMATTTGTAWSGDKSLLNSASGGYIGSPMGVSCFYSNYPDTANSAADVCSGIWADPRVGANEQYCPFAYVEMWSPRVKMIAVPESPGVRFSITYAYGVGTKRPAAGIYWATDA
jgi:hypothetical protein